MNADAELDAALRRHAGVALDHRGLHFDRAAHGVDHAAELDEQSVARALDDASVVHGDGRVDQVAAQRPEPRQDAILVRARRAGYSRRRRRKVSPRFSGSRSLLRHPGLAQAFVRPLVHLEQAWIVALGYLERLPCRDRPERPGGRQREIAPQRLTRFRIMIGQGERRHEDQMRMRDCNSVLSRSPGEPAQSPDHNSSARNWPAPCRRTNRRAPDCSGRLNRLVQIF